MDKHFWVGLLLYHSFAVFEKRSHVGQGGLKLAMWPWVILNSSSPCLHLLTSELISLCFMSCWDGYPGRSYTDCKKDS